MQTPAPRLQPAETVPPCVSDSLGSLVREGRPVPRDAALSAFRRHLARIQAHVQHSFEQDHGTGLQSARLLAALMDGLIGELFSHAVRVMGEPERLTLAATGGYGRGTLAPFSDIDLLFLTPKQPSAHTEHVVEYMLYFLWDLGLKVGHA